VGCVCGHLIYAAPTDANATAGTGSLYWRMEERIKELESRVASVIGADGSIFAIPRRLHRPPPSDLIDDMFVSLSILCGGHRIVRAAGAVAHEAIVSRPAEEFHRKVRIACQAFNVHRALWPSLRRLPPLELYMYASHKMLRWLIVYLLAGGIICLLLSLLCAGAPLAAGVLAGMMIAVAAIAFLLPIAPLAKAATILTAFFATGLGVLRSLAGERYQTWNPPGSARAKLFR
jgi:hypothetical protein